MEAYGEEGQEMKHRSHISSKRAKALGWSRLPSEEDRLITRSMSSSSNLTMGGGDDNLTYSSDTVYTGSTGGSYITWAELNGHEIDYHPKERDDRWDILFDRINKEKERQVTKGMRSLYKVYVVDPRKSGRLLAEETVIAENEGQAMLKASVSEIASKLGFELEQLDIHVECIETFIRPRKDTQRVKVVKEEDE